jgi:hypothetical protein
MVPERGFAFTMLTNSDGGDQLHNDLFADDWALRRFAGISNLPAVPRALTPGELAPDEGRYVRHAIEGDGSWAEVVVELRGDQGQLHMTEWVELPSSTDPYPDAKSLDWPSTATTTCSCSTRPGSPSAPGRTSCVTPTEAWRGCATMDVCSGTWGRRSAGRGASRPRAKRGGA